MISWTNSQSGKFKIVHDEVEYLGHVITFWGLQPKDLPVIWMQSYILIDLPTWSSKNNFSLTSYYKRSIDNHDNRLHPVVYASRSGSTSEANYTISDLVTLAMVWGVAHFHYYLYGHNVTAVTDHTTVIGASKSHRKDEQSTVCYCGGWQKPLLQRKLTQNPF